MSETPYSISSTILRKSSSSQSFSIPATGEAIEWTSCNAIGYRAVDTNTGEKTIYTKPATTSVGIFRYLNPDTNTFKLLNITTGHLNRTVSVRPYEMNWAIMNGSYPVREGSPYDPNIFWKAFPNGNYDCLIGVLITDSKLDIPDGEDLSYVTKDCVVVKTDDSITISGLSDTTTLYFEATSDSLNVTMMFYTIKPKN